MEYRRCNRCVMDTIADPNITFDAEGNCNYCTNALSQINTTTYFPGEEGQHRLQAALERIKADGRGKPYDCIMGISGGWIPPISPILAISGGCGSWPFM